MQRSIAEFIANRRWIREFRIEEGERLSKFRDGFPRSNVRITSELSSYRITKETPAQRTSLLGRDRDSSLCVQAGSDRAL
jgi:hypothetical protein